MPRKVETFESWAFSELLDMALKARDTSKPKLYLDMLAELDKRVGPAPSTIALPSVGTLEEFEGKINQVTTNCEACGKFGNECTPEIKINHCPNHVDNI